MGLFSVFGDARGGYSPLESLMFDRMFINIAGPLHDAAMAGIAPLVQPGMRCLDVGCGGGQFALRLAERFPNITIVGLDLSQEQVDRATRRSANLSDRLSFVQGSALNQPFKAGEFDLVYSTGCFKHWPDHALGLRECARVSKPGAPLYVMEGDRGSRQADLERLVAAWNLPRPMRKLGTAFFRVMVAGQSLDIVDAQAVLATIPTIDAAVERVPGMPAWAIIGRRAP